MCNDSAVVQCLLSSALVLIVQCYGATFIIVEILVVSTTWCSACEVLMCEVSLYV